MDLKCAGRVKYLFALCYGQWINIHFIKINTSIHWLIPIISIVNIARFALIKNYYILTLKDETYSTCIEIVHKYVILFCSIKFLVLQWKYFVIKRTAVNFAGDMIDLWLGNKGYQKFMLTAHKTTKHTNTPTYIFFGS